MLNGARLSSLVTVAAVPVGAAAAPTGTAGGDEAPAATGSGSFAAALERAQVAVDEALHGPCLCAGEPAPAAPAAGSLGASAAPAGEVPADAGTASSVPITVSAEPSTRTGAAEAASRDGTSPLGHPARSTRHINAGRAAHDAAASASATDRPAPAPTSGSVADPSRPAPPPLAGGTGSTAALASASAAAAAAAAAAAPAPAPAAAAAAAPAPAAAAAAETRGEAVTATAAPGATAAGAGAGAAAGAEPVAGGAPASTPEPALQPTLGAPASTPEPALQPTLGAPAAAPAAAAGTPAAAPGWHESRLAAAVDTPQFAPALGAQLSVLVRDGVQQARLHLNPAEMGPITVQINLEGTAARIEMVAEHALTRQLLEQAMPVLAGALRDSGLTLAGGGVFEQPRRPPEGAMAERGPATQGLPTTDGEAPAAMAMPARRLLGALDVYA